MQNFKLKNKKGFTLPEILIGVSIFVLVMGALTLFSRNIWYYGSYVSAGLNDSNNGRAVLKTLVSEIRTASTADTGAYVIALANSTAFTFYSDIDNDGLKEKVRYFLNGSLLQKGVIKPTGSPLSYVSVNETLSTLLSNVTNASIFNYYDKNYEGTTAALGTPVTISSVRLVKITITIDKDPNRAPVTTTFSTQVSIRNLKDNL
jgi:prepilin-type N-terminal cleavage/methylation domain-containing protein